VTEDMSWNCGSRGDRFGADWSPCCYI